MASKTAAAYSPYEDMFGASRVGRPVGTGESRGGSTRLTEMARRRAKRVLVEKHIEEFETLFALELEYLEGVGLDGT